MPLGTPPFGILDFRSYVTHLILPAVFLGVMGFYAPTLAVLIPPSWIVLASTLLVLMLCAPFASYGFGIVRASDRSKWLTWFFGISAIVMTIFLYSDVTNQGVFAPIYEAWFKDTFFTVAGSLPAADGGGGWFGVVSQGEHKVKTFWQLMVVSSALTGFLWGIIVFSWIVLSKWSVATWKWIASFRKGPSKAADKGGEKKDAEGDKGGAGSVPEPDVAAGKQAEGKRSELREDSATRLLTSPKADEETELHRRSEVRTTKVVLDPKYPDAYEISPGYIRGDKANHPLSPDIEKVPTNTHPGNAADFNWLRERATDMDLAPDVPFVIDLIDKILPAVEKRSSESPAAKKDLELLREYRALLSKPMVFPSNKRRNVAWVDQLFRIHFLLRTTKVLERDLKDFKGFMDRMMDKEKNKKVVFYGIVEALEGKDKADQFMYNLLIHCSAVLSAVYPHFLASAFSNAITRRDLHSKIDANLYKDSLDKEMQGILTRAQNSDKDEGSSLISVGELIGDLDVYSFKGNGLADGWDQGKLDAIRTRLANPVTAPTVTKEEWAKALNEILAVRMRIEDYLSMEESPSIRDNREAQALLEKAMDRFRVMTRKELESLNRALLEAVYPKILAKSQNNDDSLKEQDYRRLNRALLEAIYPENIQKSLLPDIPFDFIRKQVPDLPSKIVWLRRAFEVDGEDPKGAEVRRDFMMKVLLSKGFRFRDARRALILMANRPTRTRKPYDSMNFFVDPEVTFDDFIDWLRIARAGKAVYYGFRESRLLHR